MIETGGEGEFSVSVGSSQTVGISSALPAIAFTPVQGVAMELSLLSPFAIEAVRLLEPGPGLPCRAVVGSTPMVFWPYTNLTADLLVVPEALSYFSQSAALPETAFSPGRNFFSRELGLFGPSASWTILGKEAALGEPLQVCTGSGDPNGCSEITQDLLNRIFDDAVRIVTDTYAFSLQVKRDLIRRGWKSPGKPDDYVRLGKPSLRRIKERLNAIRPEGSTIYTCPAEVAEDPPLSVRSCQMLPFPKEEFRMEIREYFSIKPKRHFEKVTSDRRLQAELAKFEKVLAEVPDNYYVCGLKKRRGDRKK